MRTLKTMTAEPLRDGDIRRALEASLVREHSAAGDTTILHEMKVYRPTARVDVAVVNGEIAAFEIKSDVDSFSRLKNQVAGYGAVFDRVSIVTTSRQVKLARQKIPRWWGISVSDGLNISVKRTAKPNPHRRLTSLLFSLTRSELISILRANDAAHGLSSSTIATLIQSAVQRISEDDIRASCRSVLKRRRGRYISPSSSSPDPISSCSAE